MSLKKRKKKEKKKKKKLTIKIKLFIINKIKLKKYSKILNGRHGQ